MRTLRSKCKHELFSKVSMNEQASRFSAKIVAPEESNQSRQNKQLHEETRYGDMQTYVYALIYILAMDSKLFKQPLNIGDRTKLCVCVCLYSLPCMRACAFLCVFVCFASRFLLFCCLFIAIRYCGSTFCLYTRFNTEHISSLSVLDVLVWVSEWVYRDIIMPFALLYSAHTEWFRSSYVHDEMIAVYAWLYTWMSWQIQLYV